MDHAQASRGQLHSLWRSHKGEVWVFILKICHAELLKIIASCISFLVMNN